MLGMVVTGRSQASTNFESTPASIFLLILILVFPLVLLFVVSRLARKIKVGPDYEQGPQHNVGNKQKER